MVDKWSSHVRTEKTLFRLAHKTMKKRKAKETKKKKWEKQAKSAFYDTLSIFPREPANSSFRIFLKAIPSPLPPPHVLPFPSLSLFFSLFLSFVLFLFKHVFNKKERATRCLAYVTYENARYSAGKMASNSRIRGSNRMMFRASLQIARK